MRGIGKRIQKLREQAEFTQESLAEEVDISASYLSAIERGVKTPTLDTFVRILNAIGAEPNEVLAEVVPLEQKEKCAQLEERIRALPVKKQKKVLRILEVIIEEAEN